MQVITIVMACDGTLQEAKKVVEYCYEVQEQLPERSEAREELFRLLTMMENRKLQFSAADFFVVNRRLIFSILNVATMYFIIIIQFRQQRSA